MAAKGHRRKVYRERPGRLLSGAKRKLLRNQGDRLRAARSCRWPRDSSASPGQCAQIV